MSCSLLGNTHGVPGIFESSMPGAYNWKTAGNVPSVNSLIGQLGLHTGLWHPVYSYLPANLKSELNKDGLILFACTFSVSVGSDLRVRVVVV